MIGSQYVLVRGVFVLHPDWTWCADGRPGVWIFRSRLRADRARRQYGPAWRQMQILPAWVQA